MPTMKCPYCAEEIQVEALKCKHCGSWLSGPPGAAAEPPVPMLSKRLVRSTRDRMLAGVCGGLAQYLGIDATLVRVLFALGSFFLAIFGGIIVYVILAFVMPSEDSVAH